MIREYVKGDEIGIAYNRISSPDDVSDVFEDKSHKKYVLEKRGEILCIIIWKEYIPENYYIFFLVSENMKASDARDIKQFLDKMAAEHMPKSCVTYSNKCDMLNGWHEFFGLVFEGYYEFKGRMLEKWSISWDGKQPFSSPPA